MAINIFKRTANWTRQQINTWLWSGSGNTTFSQGSQTNRLRNKNNAVRPDDIMRELPSFSRWELVRFSRYLDQNQSYVSGLYSDIVDYVIRNGFTPEFLGGSPEWRESTKTAFLEWAKNPTAAGRNDLTAELKVIIRAWLRDGEVFPCFTFKSDGTPCVQTIETHVFRDYVLGPNGPIDGYVDGVKYSDTGEATAYRTFAGEDVPSSSIMQVGKATRANQLRYFPPCSPAINSSFDAGELNALATQGFKLQLALPIVVMEAGGPPVPGSRSTGAQSAPSTSDTNAQRFEEVTGAALLKLNPGSQVNFGNPVYPGPLYTIFKESLWRDLCICIGWPYDFLTMGAGQGTQNRVVIEKAKAFAEIVQDTMAGPVYRRAMLHWLAWAIAEKRITAVSDWYKVSYRKPRDMSIDLGRDTKALMDETGRLLMGPDEYFALYGQTAAEEFAKGAATLGMPVEDYKRLWIEKNYGSGTLALMSGFEAKRLEVANANKAGVVDQKAVQDTALNGAQVTSLADVLAQVAVGTLPLETGKAMVKASFPAVSDDLIEAMFAPLKGFLPAQPTQAIAKDLQKIP